MEYIPIYLGLIFLLLCIMVAVEGSKRHVGAPLAFIVSFVTTPIIGLIVVALSRRL
jgi:hypothetical protein